MAKKSTWLYAFGTALPSLRWGHDPDQKSQALVSWCGNATAAGDKRPRVQGKQAAATPLAFRDELLGLARSVKWDNRNSDPDARHMTKRERSGTPVAFRDERSGTPVAFRDELIGLARTVER